MKKSHLFQTDSKPPGGTIETQGKIKETPGKISIEERKQKTEKEGPKEGDDKRVWGGNFGRRARGEGCRKRVRDLFGRGRCQGNKKKKGQCLLSIKRRALLEGRSKIRRITGKSVIWGLKRELCNEVPYKKVYMFLTVREKKGERYLQNARKRR